jgi:hypothetical protein
MIVILASKLPGCQFPAWNFGNIKAILRNQCLYELFDSRAGVAQYMKTEWRVVAIFNVILFVILVSHSIKYNTYNVSFFHHINGRFSNPSCVIFDINFFSTFSFLLAFVCD